MIQIFLAHGHTNESTRGNTIGPRGQKISVRAGCVLLFINMNVDSLNVCVNVS